MTLIQFGIIYGSVIVLLVLGGVAKNFRRMLRYWRDRSAYYETDAEAAHEALGFAMDTNRKMVKLLRELRSSMTHGIIERSLIEQINNILIHYDEPTDTKKD